MVAFFSVAMAEFGGGGEVERSIWGGGGERGDEAESEVEIGELGPGRDHRAGSRDLDSYGYSKFYMNLNLNGAVLKIYLIL